METIEQISEPHDAPASHRFSGLHRGSSMYLTVAIVVSALVGGIVGGVASPIVLTFAKSHMARNFFGVKQAPLAADNKTSHAIDAVSDDDVVVDLVEKNSPGVVSIVISKDIPKVRSFFGSPFGMGMPFFSDPFNTQEQNRDDARDGAESTAKKQQIGSGSGFFITSDGLIVTNKHVVSDEQADYTVMLSNSDKEYPAKVLARDPNNDIAVLKIDGAGFPALSLGDSDAVKAGETVLAIGNPLGEFANSVSRGIVSGLRRSVSAGSSFGGDMEKLTGIIQTDAAINPGNSGGPLFNLSGQVIGVNVAMAQGAENIGFALPINSVKKVVDQVTKTGRISTPYIGVRYVILNDVIKKQNGLDFNYGALVLRGQTITDFAVIPGSPADKAGIVENDIILEINSQKIDEQHPLASLINQLNVGDEIAIKLWHKGTTKDIKVKLEERK